jgi:hypothetical protein
MPLKASEALKRERKFESMREQREAKRKTRKQMCDEYAEKHFLKEGITPHTKEWKK